MEDDECLTYGLCPACFCIDFDSPDLSYEPRPIADIVAGCKIGCAFCGLLTYSLNLKYCMVDGKDVSGTYVCLEKYYELRIDKQDCIVAVLYSYSDNHHGTAKLDITVIGDHDETLEDSTARKNALNEVYLTIYHRYSFPSTSDINFRIREPRAGTEKVLRVGQKPIGDMHRLSHLRRYTGSASTHPSARTQR